MSDFSNERLVVLDEPTMIWALIASSSTFADYPRPLARSSNPHADALGVAIHRRQWGRPIRIITLWNVTSKPDAGATVEPRGARRRG